jgi:cytochrome c oxidase assembly protein subunit 15
MLSVITMIVVMTCIGGITRLTGSGLSITEWKPIMGAIPPLNDHDWLVAFQKYQQIPQFQHINPNMTLDEFKFIFFWEYLHRLFGRLIGLVVLLPGVWWMLRKKITGALAKKVWLGFGLGGLQGVLGWFMVASGLNQLVYVSHFRLAAHLLLALFILAYWVNLYLEQISTSKLPKTFVGYPKGFSWVAGLLIAQLTFGAFVAGLKAGLGYNTFPKMGDEWIASEVWLQMTSLTAWVNNPAHVQFVHRWLAILLFAVTATVFIRESRNPESPASKVGRWFFAALCVQVALGIATLLGAVPLVLAVMHQFMGCVLVILLTTWRYRLRQ